MSRFTTQTKRAPDYFYVDRRSEAQLIDKEALRRAQVDKVAADLRKKRGGFGVPFNGELSLVD